MKNCCFKKREKLKNETNVHISGKMMDGVRIKLTI